MRTLAHTRTLIATLLSLGAVAAAAAGPLNPPIGPVASTGKTTQEVYDKVAAIEPRIPVNATNTPPGSSSLFKITQSGSYYLTGNIAGQTGKHGIEIAVGDVTLDLGGFELAGVPGSQSGVTLTFSNLANIRVTNGTVRSWGVDGVAMAASGAGGRVDQVHASGNGASGISIGFSCSAVSCDSSSNTGSGIVSGAVCIISGCTAASNTQDGFFAGTGTLVTQCSSYFNTGNGINTNSNATITGCVSSYNTLDGIRVSNYAVVRGNTCTNNGLNAGDGAGIHATSTRNVIDGNVANAADRGITIDQADNIIIRNTCGGNTTNWVIAANNFYGPIIDRSGSPVTAAVSGSVASSTLTTTDPFANFSY